MLVTKYEAGIIVFQIETLINPDILFICWNIFEPSGRKDLQTLKHINYVMKFSFTYCVIMP